MLRTRRPAWRSRPAMLLWGSTLAVALLALALPFMTPLARLFGLVPLPGTLLAALGTVVLGYAGATEWVKQRFYHRTAQRRRPPHRHRR